MIQDDAKADARETEQLSERSVRTFTVVQQTAEAQDAQASAAKDILERTKPKPDTYEAALKTLEVILKGASPDDAAALSARCRGGGVGETHH